MTLDVGRIVEVLAVVTANNEIIPPPRSWKKAERELFTTLPNEIQKVIARREDHREKIVRRSLSIIGSARGLLQSGDVEGATKALQKKPYEEDDEPAENPAAVAA